MISIQIIFRKLGYNDVEVGDIDENIQFFNESNWLESSKIFLIAIRFKHERGIYLCKSKVWIKKGSGQLELYEDQLKEFN